MELKLVFTLLLLLVGFLPVLVATIGNKLTSSETSLLMLVWGLSFLSLHIIINTL